MIQNTFQHIPGFGTLKEKALWESNIRNWDEYDNQGKNQLTLDFYKDESIFTDSREAFAKKDADFFANYLPSSLFYRIAHSFPEKTLFVDIETTGLSRYYNHVTLIGWGYLDKYDVYIDKDLEAKNRLIQAFKNASVIVTFNGALFDIPFIKMAIPDIHIPQAHIDLRFLSKRVGLRGGQKKIEEILNYKRPTNIIDIDGLEATILWHRYKEGDTNSLKKLIQYNSHDIDGMKFIFEKVTRSLLEMDKTKKSAITTDMVFPFSNYLSSLNFSTDKHTQDEIFLPKYSGRIGPALLMQDLQDVSEHRIIGIDLTGSEKKPSGWAFLEGSNVITKTILTDADLIAQSIECRPTIISIDSPLSLPVGRVSVYDSDPGRNEFGITRECERMMAKRGVKSYPCLIQSMQKLTERGIKLANSFRKLGYAVIESYPGAAQDILGIPRKKKSREFLIKGLKNFGIVGEYDQDGVTHDEIDAITSALVGTFFLANKYEKLGNEQEDYLIIPDLTAVEEQPNVVIGLSGNIDAGKTTSGEILKSLGYQYGRYSMVISAILEREGMSINRTNQQMKGEYVNKNMGQRWLGNELIKLFSSKENIVIDGLRFLEDHAFLREKFGVKYFHIHIVAEEEIRRSRYIAREVNDKTFDEANSHAVENEIQQLKNFSDIVLLNDSTIADLKLELSQIARKLCQ